MYVFLCRLYQFFMRIAMNFLPWREPILIKGEGSLTRLPEFIKNEGVERVLVVTDAGLMSLVFWSRFFWN